MTSDLGSVADEYRKKSNSKRRRIFVNRVAKALGPILEAKLQGRSQTLGGGLDARDIAKRLSRLVQARRYEIIGKARVPRPTPDQVIDYVYKEVATRRPDLVKRFEGADKSESAHS